jgi:DNA polymerase-3 subunit delta
VKILPKDAQAFVSRFPQGDAVAVLCYGRDAGRAALTAEQMIERFKAAAPSAEIFKKDFNDWKSDPASLHDALYALSFFSDRKLFLIRNCPASLPEWLKGILDKYRGADRFILLAEELPPASSLRKYAEGKETHIAAIACYQDDGASMAAFVREFLERHKLRADGDAVRALAQSLPGDRMLMTRELEKLAVYKAGDDSPVSVRDVEDVIDLEAEAPLNRLCQAVFEGDALGANAAFRSLSADGVHGVAMARALQKHAQNLERMAVRMLSGMSADDAVKAHRPPIFFRDAPSYKKQLQLWSAKALDGARAALLGDEAMLKSSAHDPDLTIQYAFLRLVRACRRERRGA